MLTIGVILCDVIMTAQHVTADAGGREPDEEQEAHSAPFLSVTPWPIFLLMPPVATEEQVKIRKIIQWESIYETVI